MTTIAIADLPESTVLDLEAMKEVLGGRHKYKIYYKYHRKDPYKYVYKHGHHWKYQITWWKGYKKYYKKHK